MYFWKIDRLKEDIKADLLSERDRYLYALIYIVLGALFIELTMYMPIESANTWDIVNSISNVAIVTIGTIFAFMSNGANEGSDFLGKYFSVSLVVAIRFLVFLVPLLVLYFLYYYYVSTEEEAPTSFVDVVPFLIWYAVLYWRICVHIKQTNS